MSSFAPSQTYVPRLRYFAPAIAEVSMEDAEKRHPDGLNGSRIRNQFYYEIMRRPPHYPGKGNGSAPDFEIAGC